LHQDAEALAWQFLLAARKVVSVIAQGNDFLSYSSDTGQVCQTEQMVETTCLWLDDTGCWRYKPDLPALLQASFDLYLPIVGNRAVDRFITAHLGQSIDARIATSCGDSFYVTGEENRKHLHCLRALSDAVIVGYGTIVADDPQLTTRAVPGANPVRVLIDPHASLQAPMKVFNDGQARTVLIHQSSADLTGLDMHFGPAIEIHKGQVSSQVERWIVPGSGDSLSIHSIVELLYERGLRRLFIEGGGVTVSRFFEACLLDRLHMAIAPLLVGEGIGALQIDGVKKMIDAHRPPYATYRMGDDILWDFDVSAMKYGRSTGAENTVSEARQVLQSPSLERIR